jgi:hypothetical protein
MIKAAKLVPVLETQFVCLAGCIVYSSASAGLGVTEGAYDSAGI